MMNSLELAKTPEYSGIIGFTAWAISERWFQISGSQQGVGRQKDQGTLWLINLFWYLAAILSIVDANYMQWTTSIMPIEELRWMGIPLIVVGLIVRLVARPTLKKTV
jgi:hypothetical protein